MKKILIGLSLLAANSAYSLDLGEGKCIKAVLDNKLTTSAYSAKSSCDGVTEGQAICMQALLDNNITTSAYSAKSSCD